MQTKSPLLGVLCAISLTLPVHAALTALPGLTGETTDERWDSSNITASSNPGFPGFPGTGAWPSSIASIGGTSVLSKISNGSGGGPYPAGGSIYYGGFSGDVNNNGGTLAVQASVPLPDLKTVIFQVEIGEAWTYDFYNDVLPTLTYTTSSGNFTVAADYSSNYEKVYVDTVIMPTGPEDVFTNKYALQWDLSGVGEEILSFSIAFTGVQHAQLYGLYLQQSDEALAGSILPAAVPEPSAALLGAVGLLAILRRRR